MIEILKTILFELLYFVLIFIIFIIIISVNKILNKKHKKLEDAIFIKHQPVIKWLGLTCFIILTIAFTYLIYVNEIPRNFISFLFCGIIECLCLFLLLIGFNTQIIVTNETLYYINFIGAKKTI